MADSLQGKRKAEEGEHTESGATGTQDDTLRAGVDTPGELLTDAPSPATKVARVAHAGEESEQCGTPASSAPDEGDSDERKLREVLGKLTKLVSDDAKLPKALSVLAKAMEASLTPENAAQFLEVVQASVTNKRMGSLKLRQAFLELFQTMDKVRDRFGSEHMFEADTVLLRRTHALLYTDDSFILAKATSVFQKVITSLSQMKDSKAVQSAPRLGHERRQAVLDALETLMLLANHQWAKPTVDVTMKLASDHRLQFPEEQREQLDEMTNKLRTLRSKAALGGSEKKRPSAFDSLLS